jgi:hypothetical protein
LLAALESPVLGELPGVRTQYGAKKTVASTFDKGYVTAK